MTILADSIRPRMVAQPLYPARKRGFGTTVEMYLEIL
jgi:hypothetical protein